MCRSQRATNTEAGKRGYLQHGGQHSCCLITLAQMSLGWTSGEKLTGEDGVACYTDPKQALGGYKKLTPRKVDREIQCWAQAAHYWMFPQSLLLTSLLTVSSGRSKIGSLM